MKWTSLLAQGWTKIPGAQQSPAMPIFYKHFPVFKRFTCTTFAYALSRAFIYVITSFGYVYCSKFLGHWGIIVVILPTAICFIYAIYHFADLEKAAGRSTL